MGDTKTTLVADLEARPPSPQRDLLIERAREGYYHDFETELPAPKMQLVLDLTEWGFDDLAAKAGAGAYDDEHPTDEQLQKLAEHVPPEVLDALLKKDES